MSTTQDDKTVRRSSAASGTKQVARDARTSDGPSGFDFSFDGVASWGATLGRIILGLVLAWFGYHEVIVPKLWTGYVPLVTSTSHMAQILVLVHGVFLCVLAVALVVGIAPRVFAAVAVLMMLEIVISLIVTAGLSDLVLRDFGVMGLALSVMSGRHEHLVLKS